MAYVQPVLTLALSMCYKDTSNETGSGPENLIQNKDSLGARKHSIILKIS